MSTYDVLPALFIARMLFGVFSMGVFMAMSIVARARGAKINGAEIDGERIVALIVFMLPEFLWGAILVFAVDAFLERR